MQDLPQGAKHTLALSIINWRQGRMHEQQVTGFLQSVKYQSTALKQALESEAEQEPEPELLTTTDFNELFASAPSSPMASYSKSFVLSRSPSNKELLQDRVQLLKVLEIVTSEELMHSAKTNRLSEILLAHTEVQRHFTGNGWDALARTFNSIPDWAKACKNLRAAIDN